MPKRPNPFGDLSPLQFKTHVGQKNVDMGVDKGHNMQSVYGRTQSLLFCGARQKCSTGSGKIGQDDSTILTRSTLPGQMTLDSCGTLFSCQQQQQQQHPAFRRVDDAMDCMPPPLHSSSAPTCNNNNWPPASMQRSPRIQMVIDQTTGHLVRGDSKAASSSSPPLALACHLCSIRAGAPSPAALRPCSCCDKATCASCLRPCAYCAKIVCTLCSNVNWDDDLIICLDCSI